MVDGQGSGGDADVEAAASLADGCTGGHGAAVSSSEALTGKKPGSWSRTEKGKLPSSLPSCPSDRQGQGRHKWGGAAGMGHSLPGSTTAGPLPLPQGASRGGQTRVTSAPASCVPGLGVKQFLDAHHHPWKQGSLPNPFPDRETEVQKDQGIHPKSHSS